MCPNCGQRSYCGCRSCLPQNQGKVLEIWLDKEIGVVACGHCGFAMIIDAWETMSWDLSKDITPEQRWDIYARFFEEGKMPGEPNYKPSFRTHWTVKLWRWRGIVQHTIEMLRGQSKPWREGSKWLTFKEQMAKF